MTPRELEVARHVGTGMRSREVAEHLGIGLRTVEAHLLRVYAKLGVDSRTRLALLVQGCDR
jgi:DNA-binding CsgD family transcriptional regulator